MCPYDSYWQFCYYNLLVKRALSVMTTKLLFKIALSPSSILALTVRPVIIKLHVWLFNLNSRYYNNKSFISDNSPYGYKKNI